MTVAMSGRLDRGLRGGSWWSDTGVARPAYYGTCGPGRWDDGVGLRLVRRVS